MIKIQTTEPDGRKFHVWVHGEVMNDGTLVLNSNHGMKQAQN
jgi:hypothetical protein